MKLYNSLTRKVEPFQPRLPAGQAGENKKVQMFVCGPTVYDFVHLGNARTFTLFDVAAKWLRHSGYEVTYLQNITDIDDKIITRAAEQSRPPLELAREYEEHFLADMQALGNTAVSQYARATDHIPQVIAQVKTLIAKGHVYLIPEDGWYFDLTTFPDYGKLSGRTGMAANDAYSRIDDNDKKRNTGDFCVWKFSQEGEPSWPDDQLGTGRPGWHIEDTAITEHFFGPQYDLHGGGMDLKFPHHEAEIAQQEAASGLVPFVQHWMHTGFLEMKNEKMSKSVGNVASLHDMLGQYDPAVLRFYLLSNHYRAPLEFTDQALVAAQAATGRIHELSVKLATVSTPVADDSAHLAAVDEARHAVEESMNDDLNTAAAFAAVFDLVRATNKALAANAVSVASAAAARDFLTFISETFGIVPSGGMAIADEIQKLVDERQEAREQSDFTAADALRTQLIGLGYTIDDTPYGPLVKKK